MYRNYLLENGDQMWDLDSVQVTNQNAGNQRDAPKR